ncbi:MAG TPA: hypothetical protein VHJ78_02615 [Actinomycetota bacterium]|nr:hypothetical protein [Actinomycetota bacterium]
MPKFRVHEGYNVSEVEADHYEIDGSYVTFFSGGKVASFRQHQVTRVERDGAVSEILRPDEEGGFPPGPRAGF